MCVNTWQEAGKEDRGAQWKEAKGTKRNPGAQQLCHTPERTAADGKLYSEGGAETTLMLVLW